MRTPIRTIFALSISLSLAALAQNLVKCAVKLNGKNPVEVNSYYPGQEPYLEVETLSSGMGWRLGRGDPKVVKLNGKRIKDFKTFKRKRYVSAQALANEFEYTLKVKQRGEVIELWSKEILESDEKPQVSVRVQRRKKRPAPGTQDRIISLKLSVKNEGSQAVKMDSRSIQIQDIKRAYHLCQRSYPLTIESGGTTKPQELSFRVPKNLQFKKLVVKDENDKVIFSTRI